jgi:hypothetical protein
MNQNNKTKIGVAILLSTAMLCALGLKKRSTYNSNLHFKNWVIVSSELHPDYFFRLGEGKNLSYFHKIMVPDIRRAVESCRHMVGDTYFVGPFVGPTKAPSQLRFHYGHLGEVHVDLLLPDGYTMPLESFRMNTALTPTIHVYCKSINPQDQPDVNKAFEMMLEARRERLHRPDITSNYVFGSTMRDLPSGEGILPLPYKAIYTAFFNVDYFKRQGLVDVYRGKKMLGRFTWSSVQPPNLTPHSLANSAIMDTFHADEPNVVPPLPLNERGQ